MLPPDGQKRVQDGQLDPQHTQSVYATVMAGQRSLDTDPCKILFHHLNHPKNAAVLPQVLQAAHAIGPAAVRLLKLLATALYVGDSLFSEGATTLGRGAFAIVQERQLNVLPGSREAPVPVVEKVRCLCLTILEQTWVSRQTDMKSCSNCPSI
jgi:hypothetical protein